VWGHLLREVKDCTRSEITCVQCRTVRLASPQVLLEHVQPSTLRHTRPHAPARTLMSALPTQAPQGPQLTRSPAPSPAPSALALPPCPCPARRCWPTTSRSPGALTSAAWRCTTMCTSCPGRTWTSRAVGAGLLLCKLLGHRKPDA